MAVAIAAACAPAVHAADINGKLAQAASPLNSVVVTGSRVDHSIFDLPAAIDVVDSARIIDGQARVNASEALVAVPGIVVQNRQNYAQDLQISSRGFGARSAFGVRGVRLLTDGIPATMPDGQGQAATFDLDMAERIEVLRGPFSAVYGNHAGGVIQLFTRDGQGAPSVEANVFAGSYGSWKADISAQGKPGAIGYVLDTSRFHTDGYRDHSAATRDQAFAKFTTQPDQDSSLTVETNGLWQHDTQDALGLTSADYDKNPRSASAAALTYNTRKSIDHVQGGMTYERRFGADSLQVTGYVGSRQVVQYQSIPKSAQVNPKSSGAVVDFDRSFGGVDIHWVDVRSLAGGKLTTTVGLDYDRSGDARSGYENFIGSQLGVKGTLRRNEQDDVTSIDPYLQAEWQSERWAFTAGLRHSRVDVNVEDKYLANGNDSGSVAYRRTTPVLALLYKATPALNLYASAARGFETPTMNELFYSGSGGTFNFNLNPAHSTHLEVGAKSLLGKDTSLNVALFQVRTEDELVVDTSSGGRTSYKNASNTLRQGMELSLATAWQHGFSGRLAVSGLYAIYDEAFTAGTTTIPAGNRLPGVASANLYGELAWKNVPTGLSTALEAVSSGKVYVEDSNTQRPAPGYTIFNARIGAERQYGPWRVKAFGRINNLLDRNYIGSVIVGDGNGRYYEPAPGRNWLVGTSVQYVF